MSDPRHTNGQSQQAEQSPSRRLHSGEDARPAVAFGPELAGIGSWEWVGADLAEELGDSFHVSTFRETVPDCDVAVIVKYKPPLCEWLHRSECALSELHLRHDPYVCDLYCYAIKA